LPKFVKHLEAMASLGSRRSWPSGHCDGLLWRCGAN
jgi:hypothetical protein